MRLYGVKILYPLAFARQESGADHLHESVYFVSIVGSSAGYAVLQALDTRIFQILWTISMGRMTMGKRIHLEIETLQGGGYGVQHVAAAYGNLPMKRRGLPPKHICRADVHDIDGIITSLGGRRSWIAWTKTSMRR